MAKEVRACKICGKECINLATHVRAAHKLSMLEYETGDHPVEIPEEVETLEEVEDNEVSSEDLDSPEISDTTSSDQLKENIFGKQEDITLKNFCLQNNITEKELRNVIKQYRGSSVIPVSQIISERTNKGIDEAKSLNEKYVSGEITTTNVFTAETLMKSYDFICKTVKRSPVKTWVLTK